MTGYVLLGQPTGTGAGTVAAGDDNRITYPTSGMLVVGQETFAREFVVSAIATATGQLRVTYFTARKSEASTQVRMYTSGTPAAATPTLCRIGLWLAAADGAASALVASTANDTALFAAASTGYTRSWSAPYTMIAGQRYAIGALIVTAAAAPTLAGAVGPNLSAESAAQPATAGLVTSLSDLPSSFSAAAAGTGAGRPYAVVLP